jgi:phage tail protein X
MTQRIAVTRQNVMLDKLCFEALTTDADGIVEESLTLNPGAAAALRKQSHVLDLGQELQMPEPSRGTKTIEQMTLWS